MTDSSSDSKMTLTRSQFGRALERLEEVLREPSSDIVRDAAIQRFEFTMDLAWKTVKAYLYEVHGVSCQSPKQCFREAYQQGLIEHDDNWIGFVDLRNQTAHTYNAEEAERIYRQLPDTVRLFQALQAAMEKVEG